MKERAHVLFLSSSPTNADRLELDREAREIQRGIEDGRLAGSEPLGIATRWAVEPLDLLREIRAVRPTVLHFAGYGARGRNGIYLQDSSGSARLITSDALKETIRAAGSSIRVVVLSACCVERQTMLLDVVDCVIRASGAVSEEGARAFSFAFYNSLAEGRSVGDSWSRGQTSDRSGNAWQLWARAGVDAGQIYVVAPRQPGCHLPDPGPE